MEKVVVAVMLAFMAAGVLGLAGVVLAAGGEAVLALLTIVGGIAAAWAAFHWLLRGARGR